MEIVAYTAAQLVVFTQSEQFNTLSHLPVSRLRALSHLHNPRLATDTPIMYMAWLNNQVEGYRMVLCDTLYHNNEALPVCWYSCVWVNPAMRGKGEKAPQKPWEGAEGLEWEVPSPAPFHTFENPPKLDATATKVVG